ncbi:rho guanine nucleotide exchange factor 38 isoform X2 [Ictalurus furcatus]|uniref:rho guanine nucleotide exchange factor 38 isoform X2 n=1 Tax=Ictalurus furcatus TaxID=66913 RepID=UPI0023501411|nr:rho guanine nucleotide exchange factor 38 isoform X2 [Ictalurus furcatus]
MDPKECEGNDRENEKEEKKEKDRKIKRRPFLRYLERRRTDTIVDDDSGKADVSINTLVRRSQSDKTEYSAKLKGKLAPHELPPPLLEPEEIRNRKMVKRSKVIEELVRTEEDYLRGLDLCIREVLTPLRNTQVVDVERLFTNMESVSAVSAELLLRLQEITAEPDPETQLIGEVFIQAKGALEDVYKIYCYHHDEASALLKSYDTQEEAQQHFRTCISALKQIYDQEGKSNLLDMGSLLIKPVQRVMKYPLLLAELQQATPIDHPDNQPLQEALTTAKIINANINEFKRRKDIVMKYKRSDDEGTLKGKLNKINIHSIRKKSDRITGYFKILTGVEPQVRDEAFDREEKLFRNLEKAVRQLIKNLNVYLLHAQAPLSNISEVQNSIMEEISNLMFFRENAQKLMERKVSFEKREKKNMAVECVQPQAECVRSMLISQYPSDRLYELKRKCNATQDQDVTLLQGELVALLEDHDPFGSVTRWLVDTGSTQGYVYSTFLKPYNPQRDVHSERTDDFDNLSLFVSGSRRGSHSSYSPSTPSSQQEETPNTDDEAQHFYAVYAFVARCEQELSLQEYQHVRILQFSDQGGNKDWWLAESKGQKGYVPANYLGKMSYA